MSDQIERIHVPISEKARVYHVWEEEGYEERLRENRLRRRAQRLGLAIRKSRAQMLSLNNQGGYRIIDPYRNWIVAGERFDLDLDDVEEFLQSCEEEEEHS